MFRLLYIDDDPALGRLIQKQFQREGHKVDLASDGDVGLTMLEQAHYDVCALDHHMPGRDGLEVLPEILSREGAPPVVYVTGAQDSRIAVAALRAGASDYVIKEASDDFTHLLMRAVREAMERRRLALETERAQIEIMRERDRAETLLREVNHRVGNSLQLVTSFIHLQRRQVTDDIAQDALAKVQARIEAVSQVHRRLYTSDDVSGVSLDGYLQGLVEELQSSMSVEGGPALKLAADPVWVSTDQAVAVGVIVAELVTNAVKYAYPEGQGGDVRVIVKQDDDHQVLLCVEDDGAGIAGNIPKGTGLGSQIMDAMATDLGSRLGFESLNPGTRAKLVFRNEPVRKSHHGL
nr:response regulator [Brevundimonas sp. UBA5866]